MTDIKIDAESTTIDTTILREAADLIDRAGWAQGTEKDDETGAMCLTGAIRYCRPVTGDTYLIREVLRKRRHAEDWNDKAGRTKDEVTGYLRSVDITDADLADTFGPQWEAIVALVRRAATLTEQEARDLAAAWDAARAAAWAAARAAARDAARAAAWDAAWDAARAAAWAAARAAARDAAWAAAWDAAWDAARAAAWAAARALSVRDLIGQHGFTQAHYDTLTGPWAAVIGPVHPDDAPAATTEDGAPRT